MQPLQILRWKWDGCFKIYFLVLACTEVQVKTVDTKQRLPISPRSRPGLHVRHAQCIQAPGGLGAFGPNLVRRCQERSVRFKMTSCTVTSLRGTLVVTAAQEAEDQLGLLAPKGPKRLKVAYSTTRDTIPPTPTLAIKARVEP